ncbi:GntR family transcriptional regulator [Shouchella clausii]|uniref:GntR family transcriptional regulator n=1 Tax=Shouchella clausii TaxID=79880 RepID=UPI00270D1CDD|nr:GntR family transcriptional regulator [Shouchella clausii]MDO7267541.1 GntR family transcriptional regulator [Shouchella clausii]MDO7287505.1 GntR family transcriptional regulator [Shouchella clausii]
MLNKDDVIPLYVQLKRLLRSQILNGEFKEMDLLPSETQLMKQFQITRTTIRKAIAELKQEGLVQQVHGKGTYVRLRETKDTVWNFQGFSDLAQLQNQKPITKVLEKETYTKEDGSSFLKLVRLRGLQSDNITSWMTIDTSHLPLKLFPGLDTYDFSNTSLYKLMRETYNTYPHFANLNIEPICGTSTIYNRLGIEEEKPLLRSFGTVLTESNIEIEHLEIIYSPNFKFKFSQYINY